MCGSRKQMYGNYLQQQPKQIVIEVDIPKTEYAPKEIPKIQWEPNRLYPELIDVLGLNPWCSSV
jgi:hypothetical protein